MKTILPQQKDIERKWHIIDAETQVVGKVATKAAHILLGKHKPTFTKHLDVGDGIIIINAEKVVFTGNKETQKKYYRYSGYPGNVRSKTAEKIRQEKPTMILEKAIAGMIPRNKHRNDILKRLKVYAGTEHPHAAQSPIAISIS